MRANNEGSIFKRADGRWTAAVSVGGGRRKFIYGKTREEVASSMLDVQRSVRDGISVPSDRLTVRDFAQTWIETIRPTVAPKTYESYESIVRVHIVPRLGRHPLSKLGPSHLEKMYADLIAGGHSVGSVRNFHARIHAMLEKAVRLDLVARNVAKLVDLPRSDPKEKPMLTAGEVKGFLAAADGHRLEALFILAVSTGARQGELLGLAWDHVDLRGGEIEIRQALQRVSGEYRLVPPKTAQSRRRVALTGLALDALRRHRARQAEEALRLGPSWQNENNLVFTSGYGTPLDGVNLLKRQFRPLAKKAGWPAELRFHDLRHITASLALGQGMPVTLVSEMLGHADASITLRTYAHAIPGAQRQVADAMQDLLTG